MNKAELIEALAVRLGDKKIATQALDAFISEVQNAVAKGDKVALTGFGSFEKRTRNARTARNPRTGEPVKVKKTSVAAFKAGSTFRDLVASGKPAKAAGATKSTAAKRTSATATKAAAATKTTTAAKKTATATKAAPAKSTATKTATAAKKTARKSATPAAAPARARGAATAKAAASRKAR